MPDDRVRRHCKHCQEKTWHIFKTICNETKITFTCEECLEMEIKDLPEEDRK